MTSDDEMRCAVVFGNIGEFKNDAHHPGVNTAVVDAVPENRVCLPWAAAVQAAMFLSLFAPD